jgi:hypothetical protein
VRVRDRRESRNMSLGAAERERWERSGFLRLHSGLSPRDLAELRSWIPGRTACSIATPPAPAAADTLPVPLDSQGAVGLRGRELLGSPELKIRAWEDHLQAESPGLPACQDPFDLDDLGVMAVLALDPLTSENGCPQVVPGGHRMVLPRRPGGLVEREAALSLTWSYQPLAPGELLWFRPGVPFRIGANYTTRPRLALHLACVPAPALQLQ